MRGKKAKALRRRAEEEVPVSKAKEFYRTLKGRPQRKTGHNYVHVPFVMAMAYVKNLVKGGLSEQESKVKAFNERQPRRYRDMSKYS